jgi:hypothetical protein
MRQATMIALLVSILVLTMQCGKNESLNSLGGRTGLATPAIADTFYFVGPDNGVLDSSAIHTDSIRWLYEFPPEGSSNLRIIISGKISGMNSVDSLNPDSLNAIIIGNTDLEVQTYTNSVAGITHLAHDSMGVFNDTVLIATSLQPGVVLPPLNSRLLVRNIYQVPDTILVLDTIPLDNPW